MRFPMFDNYECNCILTMSLNFSLNFYKTTVNPNQISSVPQNTLSFNLFQST
uniref:Uncharacterized protein n=1 Tax=Ciona intestinalis TaxID=7719 RepID=H2XVL8_CIOIN